MEDGKKEKRGGARPGAGRTKGVKKPWAKFRLLFLWIRLSLGRKGYQGVPLSGKSSGIKDKSIRKWKTPNVPRAGFEPARPMAIGF